MLRFTFNENDIHFELRTTHISSTIVIFWAQIVITYYGIEVVLEDRVTLVIPSSNNGLLEEYEDHRGQEESAQSEDGSSRGSSSDPESG